MSNLQQYIFNSESCDPTSERIRRRATNGRSRSRDETREYRCSDTLLKSHPPMDTLYKGVMAETKAPATFQDIVWTPRPDASKDHSIDSPSHCALNNRVETQANEAAAKKDNTLTQHPDARKGHLPGSSAHSTPHKLMKSQAKNTAAFQDIVWTPSPDAVEDHLPGTSANDTLHTRVKDQTNRTFDSQDNFWTQRPGASNDHLPGSSARTTPNKPLKAPAYDAGPVQEIVWTPRADAVQNHTPGGSALGTQRTRENNAQDSMWTQRPGTINHHLSGSSGHSAPRKQTNAPKNEAIQDIVWTPHPHATKDHSLDSSARHSPQNRVIAQAIEPASHQDIIWTRRSDSSTDQVPGRSKRGTVNEYMNAQGSQTAASQGIARTPSPGVNKCHSPVDASRGTRNGDAKCKPRNPAVFQEITWTPSLFESNQHSPEIDGAKIKSNEQRDHPRERTHCAMRGKANAEWTDGKGRDWDSFLTPKEIPNRMTDDGKVNNPSTDVDSDDESTYTSFDIAAQASVRLAANPSLLHAEKADSLLPTKPQREERTASDALLIKSNYGPSEESDDDEYDYYEDDGFDEFHAYIPQSLMLSDPDSSDVMTCASAPDQAYNDDATVIDEEAFQGELWTTLHPKAGIRDSNDVPQSAPPQKSNKYSDLVVPSTQRPTFSNPYRRHAWQTQTNPLPPPPSNTASPASASIALKNAELYSKIDARLIQVSARNDLDDLRRNLEDLKTSTKSAPLKETI